MNSRDETVIALVVDGAPTTLVATGPASLLHVLRDHGHVAVKGACEQGECGSCSVLLDGDLVCACLVAASTCADTDVRTARSLVSDDLVAAFERHGAVQCGFCTPGFVVATEWLLATSGGTVLARDAVIEALAGNLCRCTGYHGIIAAVLDVARERAAVNGR